MGQIVPVSRTAQHSVDKKRGAQQKPHGLPLLEWNKQLKTQLGEWRKLPDQDERQEQENVVTDFICGAWGN